MTRPAVHASCRILPTYKDWLPRLISELFSSPLTLSGQSRLGRPAPVFNHDVTAPGFDATHVPGPGAPSEMARGSYSRSLRWYKGSVYRMNACVAVAQIAPSHSPAEAIRKGRQRLDGGWSRHGTSGRGDPPHPLQPGRRRRPGESYRSGDRKS